MQHDLFSTPPAPTRPKLPARNRDSSTSFDAAVDLEASGRGQDQRSRTLHALDVFIRAHGYEPTSAELGDQTQYQDSMRWLFARRLPELRARGLVENGPIRACRATGNRAMVWRLTERGQAEIGR